ncbi:MAG TPA: hypothetical protein DEO86_02260 [Colwellia sp.]|nr:hypothetical protein [Colwellia sp.]|tara:strand:+ start:981 stop:1415 length:435 start_codon:yes stop_codon:yes gene_type:complete
MQKILGHIGVDSGQVMVGDPCYLSKWKDNEYDGRREYLGRDLSKLVWPEDFTRYDEKIEPYGKTMNEMLKKRKFVEIKGTPSGEYSYKGACEATVLDKRLGGEIGKGLAVACSSGWGDGSYPVIATYNEEGRVASLTIKFIEDE